MVELIVRAAKAVKAGAEWVIEKVSNLFGSVLPTVKHAGAAAGVAVVAVGLAVAPITTIAIGVVVIGGLYAAYKAAQEVDAHPGQRPVHEALVDATIAVAEAAGLVFAIAATAICVMLLPEVALFVAAVMAWQAIDRRRAAYAENSAYAEYAAAGVM